MSVTLRTIAIVTCTHPKCGEALEFPVTSQVRDEINAVLARHGWATRPSDDVDPLPTRTDLCGRHKGDGPVPAVTGRRVGRR